MLTKNLKRVVVDAVPDPAFAFASSPPLTPLRNTRPPVSSNQVHQCKEKELPPVLHTHPLLGLVCLVLLFSFIISIIHTQERNRFRFI